MVPFESLGKVSCMHSTVTTEHYHRDVVVNLTEDQAKPADQIRKEISVISVYHFRVL